MKNTDNDFLHLIKALIILLDKGYKSSIEINHFQIKVKLNNGVKEYSFYNDKISFIQKQIDQLLKIIEEKQKKFIKIIDFNRPKK